MHISSRVSKHQSQILTHTSYFGHLDSGGWTGRDNVFLALVGGSQSPQRELMDIHRKAPGPMTCFHYSSFMPVNPKFEDKDRWLTCRAYEV